MTGKFDKHTHDIGLTRTGGMPQTTGNKAGTLPAVFICTLPKSGSVFLHTVLEKSLNLKPIRLDTCDFPVSLYDRNGLAQFMGGNAISQAHLEPTPLNFLALCMSLNKMILHIRDPRSSMISWLHFMDFINREIDEGRSNVSISPQHLPYIGGKWLSSLFDNKFEICLKYFYSESIEWLSGWFSAVNFDFSNPKRLLSFNSKQFSNQNPKFSNCPDRTVDVLLSTHEDLVSLGDDFFFERILDFYKIPKALFQKQEIKKDMRVHFRSGRTDAWKTELTPEQQERVTAMLPQEWCSSFGWG